MEILLGKERLARVLSLMCAEFPSLVSIERYWFVGANYDLDPWETILMTKRPAITHRLISPSTIDRALPSRPSIGPGLAIRSLRMCGF